MIKKKLYYSEAERLYVYEFMTITEISARLNVSARTLKSWKKENCWTIKRKEFIQKNLESTENIYTFSVDLLEKVKKDLGKGFKVSAGRIYKLNRMIALFLVKCN